jgi:hypothetical protein
LLAFSFGDCRSLLVDSHVLHDRCKHRWLEIFRVTLAHNFLIGHTIVVLLVKSLPVNHPLALNHGFMRVLFHSLRFIPLLALLIQLMLVLVQAFIHMLHFLQLREPILLS